MNTQQKIEQYRQWLDEQSDNVKNGQGYQQTMAIAWTKFNELFPEEEQLAISDDHALQVIVDMDNADDSEVISILQNKY